MMMALALAAVLATPQAAAAPADPPPVVQSPQDKMDALQQVYDESCGNRGYGEYDDVCNSIRDQIRAAAREIRKRPSRPQTAPPQPASASSAPAPQAEGAASPPN